MGIFLLEMSGRGLYAVRFPRAQRATCNGQRLRCALTADRCAELAPLFKKLRKVKLDLTGFTPFQRKVYAALRKVPAGRTVTYAELARRAGYPGAARAVGTAMKKNRLPIAIPCHRVIKADGSLGQYSQGKHWKRELLTYEKYFAVAS